MQLDRRGPGEAPAGKNRIVILYKMNATEVLSGAHMVNEQLESVSLDKSCVDLILKPPCGAWPLCPANIVPSVPRSELHGLQRESINLKPARMLAIVLEPEDRALNFMSGGGTDPSEYVAASHHLPDGSAASDIRLRWCCCNLLP